MDMLVEEGRNENTPFGSSFSKTVMLTVEGLPIFVLDPSSLNSSISNVSSNCVRIRITVTLLFLI